MTKLISLIFLIIIVSSCTFSKKKSRSLYAKAQVKAPYDAIIVPGVPYDGVAWSETMKNRVLWSYYLYENGITKNIIYSGGAVYTKYSESKIMAEYGKALGIPASNILLDTLAEHSCENLYYSYLVAKRNDLKKVAFATDPFQAKSLKGMINKLKLPIDLIPLILDSISNANYPEPSINGQIAIENNFISIKERESFFFRLKGTLGNQILFYEEDLPNDRTIKKFRKKGQLVIE
jgi:uncharacterized SAM-binding protein YcdF (DUF218 family)